MAMAMPASVTVSMGEETSGVFRVILLVSAEVRSWRGGRRRAGVGGGGVGERRHRAPARSPAPATHHLVRREVDVPREDEEVAGGRRVTRGRRVSDRSGPAPRRDPGPGPGPTHL